MQKKKDQLAYKIRNKLKLLGLVLPKDMDNHLAPCKFCGITVNRHNKFAVIYQCFLFPFLNYLKKMEMLVSLQLAINNTRGRTK